MARSISGKYRLAMLLGAAMLVWSAADVAAQTIRVGPGATVDLGDGVLAGGCADLDIAGNFLIGNGSVFGLRDVNVNGVLAGGGGGIGFSGDFSVSGVFDAGSGRVGNVDGCGVGQSTFSGGPVFHTLALSSSSGRVVRFASGQSVAVGGSLDLRGSADGRLVLRASRAGAPAFLNLAASASQRVEWVEVGDIWGTGQALAPGSGDAVNSLSVGNTPGWFGAGFVARQIPMDGTVALLLLALGVLALGWGPLRGLRQ